MRMLRHAVTPLGRLAAGLLLVAACHNRSSDPIGGPGAASARAAVDQFMGAVRAQDLQALSTIWGTTEGPARDRMSRPELERRELLMMCYLTHEEFAVREETGGANATRVLRAAITSRGQTLPTTFTVVRGPNARWYVQDADLSSLQGNCRRGR